MYPDTRPTPAMVKLYGPTPPVIVTIRLVDWPEQMVAVPERAAEAGAGLTDTVAFAPAAPTQVVASVTAVMVYVVLTVGVTETVCPDEIPVKLKLVTPSV